MPIGWTKFVFRRSVVLMLLVGGFALWAEVVHAQLQFTEVMHSPLGDENRWEWVEVRNTSSSAIDLDGWIFDDDDDAPVSMTAVSNIKATGGNTIVPALGVAVLYAGSNLDFMPARFTNVWGAGVTLIPVNNFTTLTDTDAIGLWPNRAAYDADDLGMGMNPRRSFAHAAASLNYASGFPAAERGRSIAWNGTGSATSGANWVESEANVLQARTSLQVVIPSTAINGADRGNPGVVPGGTPLAGLRITEVMYDPESPEPDWEWVEIYNNTGSAIDFTTQPHVLHDDDGTDFTQANITSGNLAQGGVGVLFNAATNTLANMQAAWGGEINFIPVTSWGNGFGNEGDTIAIWPSIEAYNLDAPGSGRSTAQAAAVATYGASDPWPAGNGMASIYVSGLNLDSSASGNWVRSGTAADTLGPSTANPILGTLVDHPGGDVGSPGYAPGAAVPIVLGDYSGNGVVDAADYTVWRDAMAIGGSLLNDASPGGVTQEDYSYWKSHFGATSSGGGSLEAVPEPASAILWLLTALVQLGRPRRLTRPTA